MLKALCFLAFVECLKAEPHPTSPCTSPSPRLWSLGSWILTSHFLLCPKACLHQTPRNIPYWTFTDRSSLLSPFFNSFSAGHMPHYFADPFEWHLPMCCLHLFCLFSTSFGSVSPSQKCLFSPRAGSTRSSSFPEKKTLFFFFLFCLFQLDSQCTSALQNLHEILVWRFLSPSV